MAGEGNRERREAREDVVSLGNQLNVSSVTYLVSKAFSWAMIVEMEVQLLKSSSGMNVTWQP